MREMRWPLISQTASEPSGRTTGPSGNSSPWASTRTSGIPLLFISPDRRLDRTGDRTAPIHERGIERHRDRAVAANGDQAAVEVAQRRASGGGQRRVCVANL